jgi:hypothetical protein
MDRKEERVAYAVVRDVAASWEQYTCLAAAMSEPAPAGLILHVAGPTDEGFRTIDLWESEQAWETFRSSGLEAAAASVVSLRPRSTFRDLRAAHIVVGNGMGALSDAASEPEKEEQ